MLVAITGGDGPIGRALQKALATRSVAFRTLVPSEPPLEISRVGEYVIGDETDADKVARLVEGADVLIHLGRAHVAPEEDFCQDELIAQSTLIPAAHRRGMELHFLSSSEVFTPPANPAEKPLDETEPVEPSSPLGVAKVAWEQTLRIWGENKGLRYVIYRVPTVVPEFLSYSNLCARYLRAGYRNGEIFPHAHQGDRWGMCYVHAEDAARLIADTIGRTEAFGDIFHVAADQWIAEHELAEMSYRVLRDFMIPCKWHPPLPETPRTLIGEVWLDNTKAKRVLGLDVSNSVARLATKMRLWIDDFGSTARLPAAE